ncbi:HU family DNA-binding protein [Cupriavidus necator]|uniref:HU family DNA-binding protein n=1 Tax=Cupriavidus necator TaxID=106590 RepID=UPI0039C18DBF
MRHTARTLWATGRIRWRTLFYAVRERPAAVVGKGEGLNLVGFGPFSKGERSERLARNPRTGEEIKVEAAKTVKFKAGQRFREAVNQ